MHVNTAAGRVGIAFLGKTLMHEHLVASLPGWESNTLVEPSSFREMTAVCVDKIAELQGAGFSSLLDPCPNDIGRDVRLMAEVAARSNFNIIFATGLYNQHLGGYPYWSIKLATEPDAAKYIADLFIHELTIGVEGTGIKAGVIKIASGFNALTHYETTIFRAAAIASQATGAPIMTHTEGELGVEQVQLLAEFGIPAHRIIVGHCCGNPDHHYHMQVAKTGAYLGFDRFGIEIIQSDEVRIDSFVKLVNAGKNSQLIVSHDNVWCFRGAMQPPQIADQFSNPLHFTRVIQPRLIEAGVSQEAIDSILTENPRRFFANEVISKA